MNKKDYLKYLLPLVAVVVIIESIVLITGMEEKEKDFVPVNEEEVVESAMVEEQVPPAGEPVLSLSFATESRMMEKGKDYEVEVNLTALDDVTLDSLEVYVTYDPEAVELSELTFDNDLPDPVFSQVSEKKNMVVANYMVVASGGYMMDLSKVTSLMTFVVRPLRPGSFDLGFATGQEDKTSVTMFVGNGSGQALPFSLNDLNVEVE